jgi:hypothetical protein
MPRLLKFGLIAIGGGVALFFVGFATGGIGMCSSSVFGFFAVMAGFCLLPIGILLSIAAGVAAVFKHRPEPIA